MNSFISPDYVFFKKIIIQSAIHQAKYASKRAEEEM